MALVMSLALALALALPLTLCADNLSPKPPTPPVLRKAKKGRCQPVFAAVVLYNFHLRLLVNVAAASFLLLYILAMRDPNWMARFGRRAADGEG